MGSDAKLCPVPDMEPESGPLFEHKRFHRRTNGVAMLQVINGLGGCCKHHSSNQALLM